MAHDDCNALQLLRSGIADDFEVDGSAVKKIVQAQRKRDIQILSTEDTRTMPREQVWLLTENGRTMLSGQVRKCCSGKMTVADKEGGPMARPPLVTAIS